MNLASALQRAVAEQAQQYADARSIPYCSSYAEAPVVCFSPYEDGSRHGNFLDSSYKAIQRNPEWKKRLQKVHTLGERVFPVTDRGRWMELDTGASSDALLMNIFCHPGALRNGRLSAFLGVEPGATPMFGHKARVPLANGRFDRTEVDMRLGDLLVEAKLTENDFQNAEKRRLLEYRDFVEVFDRRELPQTGNRYASYQLIRNILAAYATNCSFCVFVDSRRPDLLEAWFGVIICVKPVELRTRLRISTWEEVAESTPAKLRDFLRAKYGIFGQTRSSPRSGGDGR